MDGVHHVLEKRIEQLLRLLGIPVGEQLHRALEIGEENGDVLALAVASSASGPEDVGEVGRREPVWNGGAASLRPGVTRGARELRAASRAEAGVRWSFRLATRTHDPPSLPPGRDKSIAAKRLKSFAGIGTAARVTNQMAKASGFALDPIRATAIAAREGPCRII